MTLRRPAACAALGAVVAVALAVVPPAAAGVPDAGAAAGSGSLSGVTVVLDPGHQLGNARYPRRTGRLVPAGGFRKPCNTVGSATRRGVPEATVVWRVSRVLRSRLVAEGARVLLTRHSNRRDRWGPCVDVRGRAGNRVDADLKLSLHGDGYTGRGRGFHVIWPADRPRWTGDIVRPSRRLALAVRAGLRSARMRVASYTAGGDGLDRRGDLATLNLSEVPTVVVELGNLRDRRDARLLTSAAGRSRVARGLAVAVRRFVG